MQHIIKLTTMVLISFFLIGCSNTFIQSSYIRPPEVNDISTTATFSVSETKDLSDFVFDGNDENAMNLAEAMTTALQIQLTTKGIFDTSGEYIINTNIISYDPGNAFKRWLVPGFGATKLSVECSITDIDGNEYAKIPVEVSVPA
ncbi:MAG: DUF4410 domain-containing protein, partial [Campylobacteraceae bacterium]|nr:DUF4410 domain-containing protein [Campylobacteraceae bacterium]